jgi:indolepyruvate ferredoxin oxidoreductase
MGQVPIAGDAIRKGIVLNGAKVEENLRAFEIGRWAALNSDRVDKLTAGKVVDLPKTPEEKIAFRERHLVAYQGPRLAKRYRKLVDRVEDPALKEAVAKGYHKVLAYKDEYEVARLLQETRTKAEEAFAGDLKLTYHLAPPLLSKEGPNGRPMKKPFKESREWMFRMLSRLKRLRGTPFDPFGYTSERRMERGLIRQYEKDMAEVLKAPGRHPEAARALAELPLQIRGFGPVKQATATAAAKRREELLAAFRAGNSVPEAAE